MVISRHSPKCRGGIVSTIADAEAGAALFPVGVVESQFPPGSGRVGGLSFALKILPVGIIGNKALAFGRDGQEEQPAQCQSLEWHVAECRTRFAGVNVAFFPSVGHNRASFSQVMLADRSPNCKNTIKLLYNAVFAGKFYRLFEEKREAKETERNGREGQHNRRISPS